MTTRNGRFWLTPPELELEVRQLLGSEEYFDPCPFPKPADWDALTMTWSKPWYLNPPFLKSDGGGPMSFVRKAVEQGGPGVIVYPVTSATHALLQAGARLVPAGRVRWLECDTGRRMPSPSLCALAILDGPSSRD